MSCLDDARAVADAVLYEGYALYPYRASSSKNQARFQWGVLMPADVVATDPSERDRCAVGLVVEGRQARLTVVVRYLQVQQRTVERAVGDRFEPVESLDVGEVRHLPWDEAVERESVLELPLATESRTRHPVPVDGGTDVENLVDEGGQVVGRLVRTRLPVLMEAEIEVRRPASPYGVALADVQIINATREPGGLEGRRPEWLRRALVAAHLLLGVEAGAFVSALDPPEWARGFVEACRSDGLYPVLMGASADDRDVMLCSPIILYDHPQLAPQSESVFFDSLEIDELLSLRTLTLSEEERREVRGTDPHTAALLDQVDQMPPDLWERLHGTVRYLDTMTRADQPEEPPASDVPWWDPGSDSTVDPERDTVRVGAADIGRGSRVMLRPGVRGADAYDLFLAGRAATVAAVLSDVDGRQHLAVTVDDDPGSDLKASHGRYLYFAPDEVEPVSEGAS